MFYLIVFLGAGIGGALRHGANLAFARLSSTFPFGTLTVNLTGSLMMGLLTGYFMSRTGLPQHLRLFLTTGFLGGFTTFSTFSLDVVVLVERHSYWLAASYVCASVLVGIAALFAGLAVFR